MKTFLRIGADYLEDARGYPSKAAAVADFLAEARELARYGQQIDASLHIARTAADVVEYPDYVLSLGPRGGLKMERA